MYMFSSLSLFLNVPSFGILDILASSKEKDSKVTESVLEPPGVTTHRYVLVGQSRRYMLYLKAFKQLEKT